MKTLLILLTFGAALLAGASLETQNDLGATDYTDINTNFWNASVHTGAVVSAAVKVYANAVVRPDAPQATAGNDTLDARPFVEADGIIRSAATTRKAGFFFIVR